MRRAQCLVHLPLCLAILPVLMLLVGPWTQGIATATEVMTIVICSDGAMKTVQAVSDDTGQSPQDCRDCPACILPVLLDPAQTAHMTRPTDWLPAAHRPEVAALVPGDWSNVTLSPQAITLRSGMALTLNGIGQGYVADPVAALLEADGLTDILIDTGEMRALGDRTWPVRTAGGVGVPLAARALATSAPRGTCFDAGGQDGHILDPRTGAPASSAWAQVTVSAPSAALADALSTAACLTRDRGELDTLMGGLPAARLEDARAA